MCGVKTAVLNTAAGTFMAIVELLAVPFKIFRVTFLSVPISIGFSAAVRGVLMVQQIISTVHGEITVVISQFIL